jgi:hypothetical protein
LLATACNPGALRDQRSAGLQAVAEIKLEERQDDVLAEIGVLVEAENQDLLIADALRPRVHRYSSTGQLLSSFGSYGSGPFEFRRIGGLVEAGDGRVLAVDPALGRLTVLTSMLTPDTILVQQPRPRGAVARFGEGLLFSTATGDRTTSVTYVNVSGMEEWTIPAPSPGPPTEYPYWGSIARISLAAALEEFVLAYSLRYPILIRGSRGELTDSIVQPANFREAAVPQLGEFSGPGSSEKLAAWLESFDVIAALTIVDDTMLVVTHGTMMGGPSNRFETVHERIDLYHLPSRAKLISDIPLPQGGRVLGGGRFLYVLIEQPPAPWTILRVTITSEISGPSWQLETPS